MKKKKKKPGPDYVSVDLTEEQILKLIELTGEVSTLNGIDMYFWEGIENNLRRSLEYRSKK